MDVASELDNEARQRKTAANALQAAEEDEEVHFSANDDI